MARAELPSAARCVIVGGGVGGTSLAYHLAELGWEDVVLLERSQLTSGSTFHSAGLVGQLRGSVSLTKMMMHSVDLYRRLGDESEFDPGWVECGGIRLASSEERMEELRRQAGWAKTFGLPLELISAEQAKEMFPLMVTDGVLGAAWLPTDGYIDPSQLTYALADGARRGGCRIFTNTRVTAIEVSDGRVRGVEVERGSDASAEGAGERSRIEAEVVVDAGGMYAAEIGRMAGVRVPLLPMSHQYLVTQPLDAVREARAAAEPPRLPFARNTQAKGNLGEERGSLPTLRDPDLLVYWREDGDGLVMGGYERQSAPAFMPEGTGRVEAIPPDFNGRLLEEEWDRFEEITENSKRRVPAMNEITVTKLINGPEAFTPDNEFCLGESEVAGFFLCAGFCAHGLAGAGGIGKVVAEWIVEGEPSLDLWHMDVRRFGAQYRSPAYTHARIQENYETYYDIRYPNHERSAGRPLRLSPVNAWHREHGAAFGEKSGWERVNWFESNAAAGDESLRPAGWSAMHWSPAIGAEHRATREAAALFDETSFAKLEITGPAAAAYLEGLCDNRVARGVGEITYTQMLNRRGGIECDFTVARLGEDRFSIVTGTAFGNHDREWMRRNLPAEGGIHLADVTSQWACFGLWGPLAREVLQPLTPQDLGNDAFPYMTLREATVGNVPVRMLRVTYVGELGWEIYCPTEYGLGLWQALWEAGEPHGMLGGGYRAIDSMRLEKGYRVWGADITPDETPYEGGVGFCVKLDKEGGFIGREALLAAKQAGPRTRLACLTLEDPQRVALGNEPVRVGGEIVGRVTTGGYGYTVERSIAYAYLPPDRVEPGTAVEIEIFGRWIPGEVAAEPLFDPKGERIRA
ncbi:MAG TPA: FAD-dependent oxidoreductase [Solirubrobacterales bacterium]|nr:FAD-dependent oxidoreductase [Solirubrobacterales bacterium]